MGKVIARVCCAHRVEPQHRNAAAVANRRLNREWHKCSLTRLEWRNVQKPRALEGFCRAKGPGLRSSTTSLASASERSRPVAQFWRLPTTCPEVGKGTQGHGRFHPPGPQDVSHGPSERWLEGGEGSTYRQLKGERKVHLDPSQRRISIFCGRHGPGEMGLYRFIRRENVRHYRLLLEQTTDEAERRVIQKLT